MSAALTAHERRRYAIRKAGERRAEELAPVLAEVDRLVAEVGWATARPVVEAVMAPVRVTGPRGVWRHRVGKQTGGRLLAALGTLPVQCTLPLTRPRLTIRTGGRPFDE
ncbi:MAG: hypothetical protein M0Z46_06420 [Actinomycetota bacterium]|nr:hypothetical protein [Actinomycetota bacterium]